MNVCVYADAELTTLSLNYHRCDEQQRREWHEPELVGNVHLRKKKKSGVIES